MCINFFGVDFVVFGFVGSVTERDALEEHLQNGLFGLRVT